MPRGNVVLTINKGDLGRQKLGTEVGDQAWFSPQLTIYILNVDILTTTKIEKKEKKLNRGFNLSKSLVVGCSDGPYFLHAAPFVLA